MSDERLRAMGHLEERRLKAADTRLKMAGLRDSIRMQLDPYKPIEALNCQVAAQQALELAALHRVYRDLLDDIAAIRRDLGEE